MNETTTELEPVKPSGVEVKKKAPLIRSICVDTFTGIQKNEVFDAWEDGKIKQDEWRDFGVSIVQFVRALSNRGFLCVGILGYEGTGKSFGMKTLPTGTNIWFNCDNKASTYRGGLKEYGPKEMPNYLHVIPKTYNEIVEKIDKVISKGMLAEKPIAFLLAHIDDYKSSNETVRQRIKTLGKISRVNIEDAFTMCYYTELIPAAIGVNYKLRTQNNGKNTGRSMEGQHKELFINNDFQAIIESIDSYE